MDWGRARTILITAFVIANIFLAYNLWETKHQGHRSERMSSTSIEEIIEILGQRGIHVNTPIPKEIYTKEALTVEYSRVDIAQLAKTVYGDGDVLPKVTEESVRYSEDGIILEVKNGREIFYNNLRLRDGSAGPLTEQEGVDLAKAFLNKYGLHKSTMIVDSVTATDEGYRVRFLQRYGDTLVEVSEVSMEVTSKGIRSMRMLWLEPVKSEKGRKKIVHAIDALIKVAGRKELLDKKPVNVNSIKLIHYFDWDMAKGGETFPVWRVCMDKGTYYVNALTGRIIKKDDI